MNRPFEPIAEWHQVDVATFRDQIFARNRPAVLRGAVAHWPAVKNGSSSPQAMCDYLLGMRQGTPVPLLTADPSIQASTGHTTMRRNEMHTKMSTERSSGRQWGA